MNRFANRFVSLILFFGFVASAHEQLILVVAETMEVPTATLQRYEYTKSGWHKVGKTIPVNIGRRGLGWGIGLLEVPHDPADPIKHEGDGKAPAGVFALGPEFGYSPRAMGSMPYLHATDDLICIDDTASDTYNRIEHISPNMSLRSFEWMRRDDKLYRHGIVVLHNTKRIPGKGSCIFLHIERTPGVGTAGCTSMSETELRRIIQWLEPAASPILVQIPRKSLPFIKQAFALP